MPFSEHAVFETPDDNKYIWRYMDFTQYVHVLSSKSLWFACADSFEDPLEGSWTDGEIEKALSLAREKSLNLTKSEVTEKLRKYCNTTEYFINCWRLAEGESMAMWDLYGKGKGIVAIKSKIHKFKASVINHP